jgi:hypothetical protein
MATPGEETNHMVSTTFDTGHSKYFLGAVLMRLLGILKERGKLYFDARQT